MAIIWVHVSAVILSTIVPLSKNAAKTDCQRLVKMRRVIATNFACAQTCVISDVQNMKFSMTLLPVF